MERPRPAAVAWALLAGGVGLYDVLAPENETMSEGFDRGLAHPVGRIALGAAGAVTIAHLYNVYERLNVQHLDPFHQVLKAITQH